MTPETNAERTLAVDIGLPHLPSAPGVLGIEQVTGKPLCSVMASSLPDRPIRHPKSNRSGSASTGTHHIRGD